MKKQGPEKQGAGVRGQGSGKIGVRAVKAALAQGKATLVELCARLAIPEADFKTRDQVRKILRDLEEFRQADAEGGPGVQGDFDWIYYLVDKPGARGAVQARLWRFAGLRAAQARPFTVAEAARLAECDRDYTKRYYRWLWKSGYLAIVSRGKAKVVFYQVVGGKEHEAAPAWNRRAEKRKRSGQGSGVRGQGEVGQASPDLATCRICGCTQDRACEGGCYWVEDPENLGDLCNNCLPRLPSSRPQPSPTRGEGDKGHRLQTGATRLDAALEDFGRALVEVAGGIERAWEIIREMKGELLAIGETCHDEPGEPTAGGH